MPSFLTDTLTPNTQYKLLTGSIVPRPIAWITTQTPDGTINLAPFSFFSVVSHTEPLVSVAIIRDHETPKDTAANLLATQNGVIHIVSRDLVAAMNQTAARLSRDKSELTLIDLPLVTSQVVATPGLADAKIRFEVTFSQHIPITADSRIVSDLMILKVVAMHFDDEVFDATHQYIDDRALDPVARLAGPNYATLGETFALKRPQ